MVTKENLLPLFSLLLLASCSAPTPNYDTLITNAMIYDGSGEAPYLGSIAIKGDTIAALGNIEGTAENIVDAQGKALAPGFINVLSWANVSLIEDGRSLSDLKQGVTLEVMGEGRSMGPLNDDMKAEMKADQSDIKYDVSWTTLGEYLQFMERKGVSTNITSFVGNGTLRQHVIGYENRPASPAEMKAMKKLLAIAMQEGAVGLSSSLLYAPSRYADTQELIELAKVAAEYGGIYISHIRDEGDQLLESVEELITIAREANIPAEIYHLKASGQHNWYKLDSVFMMIEAAREEGLQITADMYTYPASSTGLHTQLPEWVREGGVDAALKRLADPAQQAKILQDIHFFHPPQNILLVGLKKPDLRQYQGKRLNEVADEWGKSAEETMINLMVQDQSRIQVVYFSMSEENIRKKIVQPWMSFCSDAGSYAAEGIFLASSTHPRAYGSFIRVLGKYSRDEGLFPLEEGIRRLSALPAENLHLDRRGKILRGYFADLVLFDPEKTQDKATFEAPHQYAEGIENVWVNGQLVLQNGEATGTFSGRYLKRKSTK
ncbi:N-acyl-D-amino-acid deacylase family protein [Lewinella cohaerens]|uniref:N-acyl-D-amino-acid deacylase family protein n=1 Tax=Lewinella cohaerens TaxID=70995 RepID=UPI000362FECB|nr:D-aminoacylase [Lewinella cohaerens]